MNKISLKHTNKKQFGSILSVNFLNFSDIQLSYSNQQDFSGSSHEIYNVITN